MIKINDVSIYKYVSDFKCVTNGIARIDFKVWNEETIICFIRTRQDQTCY